MDKNNLAHTTWECKYHLVFAAKYRRQVIYGKIKQDIGKMLRGLCERKGIEIIEAECCKDHIHICSLGYYPNIAYQKLWDIYKAKAH